MGRPRSLCTFLFTLLAFSSSEDSSSCDSNNGPAWWLRNEDVRTLQVPSSDDETVIRTLTVERLSITPPIFRVPNFLTAPECTLLRRLAAQQDMTDGRVDSDDGLLGGAKKKMGIFDFNHDGRLDVYELIRMMDDFFESHVDETDIRSMLASIGQSLDDNQTISIQDFVRSDTKGIAKYFTHLIQQNPSKRSRHSQMTWIHNNDHNSSVTKVLDSIQKRVQILTQLPPHLIHGSMEMQVVHYPAPAEGGGGGGHYTAHFDSLPLSDQPCCHIAQRTPPCRPCRLATLLYSLSDNDDGGHTAFPLATNNTSQRMTSVEVEEWRFSSASREQAYCAPNGPGLRIAPKLGQAILWYNHHGFAQSSSLGELDRSTLHAGCPLQKEARGKWIANHWIEASDIPGEDEQLHHRRRL